MKRPLDQVMICATKGPMRYLRGAIISGPDYVVAECCSCPDDEGYSMEKSNAALLAHFRNIGPELVEALDTLANLCVALSVTPADIAKVKAILSRAKEVEL